MSLQQGDVVAVLNFGIQIDGVEIEFLAGATTPAMEQDVIEYQQNSANGQPITKKMPGAKKAGECTVTRGMNQSRSFNEWINSSIAGDMGSARKNATLIMMDYQMNPVRRYNMRNAWCSSIKPADPQAGEAAPMTETVTIVFEDLDIE